jgi:sugar/nucleoside kinase (ribokinase family)
MKNFKVETSLIEIDKQEESGYSVIFLDESGDRTALSFRGAADFKKFKKIKATKLNTNWFFITTLNGNLILLKQLFKIAKKKKISIAWNPGNAELAQKSIKLKPWLRQAEVVFLNFKEAQNLINYQGNKIETIFTKLSKLAPTTLWCVTGGKHGAWVQERKNIYWANILPKKVVNVTGAGDAFGSGFVSGLILYKNNLKKALQLAMLNSNSVVTQMGAKHGLLKKPPSIKLLNKIKVKIIK